MPQGREGRDGGGAGGGGGGGGVNDDSKLLEFIVEVTTLGTAEKAD